MWHALDACSNAIFAKQAGSHYVGSAERAGNMDSQATHEKNMVPQAFELKFYEPICIRRSWATLTQWLSNVEYRLMSHWILISP